MLLFLCFLRRYRRQHSHPLAIVRHVEAEIALQGLQRPGFRHPHPRLVREEHVALYRIARGHDLIARKVE